MLILHHFDHLCGLIIMELDETYVHHFDHLCGSIIMELDEI